MADSQTLPFCKTDPESGRMSLSRKQWSLAGASYAILTCKAFTTQVPEPSSGVACGQRQRAPTCCHTLRLLLYEPSQGPDHLGSYEVDKHPHHILADHTQSLVSPPVILEAPGRPITNNSDSQKTAGGLTTLPLPKKSPSRPVHSWLAFECFWEVPRLPRFTLALITAEQPLPRSLA